MRTFVLILLLAPVLTPPAFVHAHAGHGIEVLDWDRPEAWALKVFASASQFAGYGPALSAEPNSWMLGLEIIQLPYLKRSYRTVGFGGQKEENLNHLPAVMRPTLTWNGPGRVSISAAYIPPIEIDDVRTHGGFAAIQWTAVEFHGWALSTRLSGQALRSRGPFTAWEELAAAGPDPIANPWGVTGPSNDRAVLDTIGGELALGRRLPGNWQPFVTISRTLLDLRFDVDSSLFGEPHQNHQEARGWQTAYSAGFRHQVQGRWEWGLQLFYAPLKVRRLFASEAEEDSLVHLRLMVARKW